jgi:hypothetical protein
VAIDVVSVPRRRCASTHLKSSLSSAAERTKVFKLEASTTEPCVQGQVGCAV